MITDKMNTLEKRAYNNAKELWQMNRADVADKYKLTNEAAMGMQHTAALLCAKLELRYAE